jgi:hypothetical protein
MFRVASNFLVTISALLGVNYQLFQGAGATASSTVQCSPEGVNIIWQQTLPAGWGKMGDLDAGRYQKNAWALGNRNKLAMNTRRSQDGR